VTPAIRVRTALRNGTAVMVASSVDGHRVAGATANPLRVIGWGGLQEHLAFSTSSLGTELAAGQPVGGAALTGALPTPANGQTQTAVRTATALPRPGILWRLEHLF
jgi:hypothetical protein